MQLMSARWITVMDPNNNVGNYLLCHLTICWITASWAWDLLVLVQNQELSSCQSLFSHWFCSRHPEVLMELLHFTNTFCWGLAANWVIFALHACIYIYLPTPSFTGSWINRCHFSIDVQLFLSLNHVKSEVKCWKRPVVIDFCFLWSGQYPL